ncbi:PAS domain S-box-containing protein [Desulfatibacillum alkenivorans DSM 16219]|uniref:histidine kinase n=1 Tax=Desulfatibacillum alkenivorans DSM 16219 TaxID=1121393 RepID=A0A1M6MEH1_9BACT|nr:PAS domain S-box protein [Desulfatibacillum alkenivorans]SHJ81859.1 PAS domain S-box-containing protein [Desulfatibacillum alkenivorans DSM 16219]
MEDSKRSSVKSQLSENTSNKAGRHPIHNPADNAHGTPPALEEMESVLAGFFRATGVSVSLLTYPEGRTAAQAGWQSLCKGFHLSDARSGRVCRDNCLSLLASMDGGDDPAARICGFGLADAALPIFHDGKQVFTLIAGQALTQEDPDPEKVAEICREYGYNRESYLDALTRIPRMSMHKLLDHLRFLAQTVARLYSRDESLKEKDCALKKLAAAKESYRSLVRSLPEIVMRLDSEGHILALNRTLDGTPVEMVLGSNVLTYISSKFRSNLDKALRKVVETGRTGELEVKAAGPNQSIKSWYEVRIMPIEMEGKPPDLTMIATDITRRKAALKALVESELKYQTMLDSLQEGFFELDLEGNLIFVNDAMCRIYGLSREEMLGLGYRQYTQSETAEELFEMFNRIYRTGEPARVVQYQVVKLDGTPVQIQMSASLKTVDGKPAGFRCICRDISHILEAQKEKDRLEKKLTQAQKLEAIGTLAGGVAHDFNNLLTGLQGNVSLMLQDLEPAHPHYDRIQDMEAYIAAATGLTRQLLGFARGGKYEVRTLDMNRLVDKTLHMFGRAAKEVTIHRDFQGSWAVDADSGQLEQVLLNLFVNAGQAMPDGGDLYIQTQNIQLDAVFVKPYSLEPGKYIKVSVTDTGHGMDEATQQKVFDPFFTTKDVSRGTGLGLSSAYGIIKNHQGMLTVYSAPGKGATFNIYLPAAAKAEVAMEEKASLGILYGSETLLLVDDEDVIIKTGGEILKALGYQVHLAGNAKTALEIFKQSHQEIDMVILDMIMPDMTGEEVYDQLKLIDPAVRVLLSSGYSLNGQAVEIMQKGCNGFIQKPFNLEQLSHKIREVLGKTDCSE